ncbi:cobalamin biosynthesis protein CbiX [Termitidicoccus mucosus]
MPDSQICFLFDNGSLRPSSTLNLRATARLLGGVLPAPVRPVSLLHSSAVDAAALGGERAELLEIAVRKWWGENPGGEAVLLPLFFGPSGALTGYVPARMEAARKAFPLARWRLARWLIEPGEADEGVAGALAAEARSVIAAEKLERPRIVLVDHGSPQRAVTAVRDHLGAQLRRLLAGDAAEIGVASMERRPGAEFAFNEPLLATRLRTPPFDAGDVVVLLQFLSPGRHAGPDGDIAAICAAARSERPGLHTWMTEPVGTAPEVVERLARRFAEGRDKPVAAGGDFS